MEVSSRSVLHDFNLASRKAEESALRRFQASAWLESFIGPLNLPTQPSEQEFVSCLRNGLILCNVINKIEPGTVPKVINTSETQPLPAYQYFENVRNFLVAVELLNLPAFEASDLERESLEDGSTTKIVDCILSLKAYHEWKQWSEGSGGSAGMNGSSKHLRSPMVVRSAGRNQSRVALGDLVGSCRHLDLSNSNEKTTPKENENGKLEDTIVKALVERLLEMKENVDHKLMASFHNGTKDSGKVFGEIMSSCIKGQEADQFPELKSILHGPLLQENTSTLVLTESCSPKTAKCKRLCCLKRGSCNHWNILEVQEKDLSDLKLLLSRTKNEFEVLQSQLQNDLQSLGNKVQEISFAALGYQRVIKENRDLYNLVQDLKGNIRVYCRIRPVFGAETKSAIDHIGDDGSLVVLDPLKPHKDARKVFQFNHVFGPTSSQDDVYKETQPLIRSVMDGYNVCIFAYGQTGSGKTHTMCGPSGGPSKDLGINYLALNDLFEISCTRKDIVNYEIRVQMVEIYNEQVRDLLTEESSTTKLEIRSCTSNGGLCLPDATMHVVNSSMDVLNLMKLGEMNRCVSSTAINHQSSRSHSVLTVHIHGKDISANILRSCLHLVDLAGSERVDKSEVTGDRLKEAQYINKSLSCLGDVITALAQKNSHIPYRNSKLTQVLQDSLGGHAKTLMFAHVSPEADSYGETVSTLKFAQRVSTVELGAAHVNKESREVKELKEQVETLKKALSSKPKEVKSPREKVKTMTDRTPPRLRRLSIENAAVKIEHTPRSRRLSIENSVVKTDRTPPRSRRLSIENSVVKTERTPPRSRRLSIENSVVKTDHTPRSRRLSIENSVVKTGHSSPRPRRLSNENSAVKSEKPMNPDSKKVSKNLVVEETVRKDCIAIHPQRLNLEVTKYGNGQLQCSGSENGPANSVITAEDHQCISSYSSQDVREDRSCSSEASISGRNHSDASSVTTVYRHTTLPSPTSAFQSRIGRTENRIRRPVQLPKTPEPPSLQTRAFQTVTPMEVGVSIKSQTPAVAMSTSKKGSQIRRSLHTIGRLIHPSDKKSRQHPVATLSSANVNNDKLSPTANARALRRQSLTGGQTTGLSQGPPNGVKPTDSYSNGKRNAKTPPPVHPSSKASKQWL